MQFVSHIVVATLTDGYKTLTCSRWTLKSCVCWFSYEPQAQHCVFGYGLFGKFVFQGKVKAVL